MDRIEHPHHVEIQGFICPVPGHPIFVVPEHLMDLRRGKRCYHGLAQDVHRPALQVIDIYVLGTTDHNPNLGWTLDGYIPDSDRAPRPDGEA